MKPWNESLEWVLTAESKLLNCLRTAEGGWVSMPAMIEAVYPDADTQPDSAERIIRTAKHRLVRRGFPIGSQYTRGYRFEPTVKS